MHAIHRYFEGNNKLTDAFHPVSGVSKARIGTNKTAVTEVIGVRIFLHCLLRFMIG